MCIFLVPFVDDVKALYRLFWIQPLLVVNALVVTLLPSNGVLMGPNGLPVWLCNCLECLLMNVLNDPVSPSGVTDPLFVNVTSSLFGGLV